VCGNGKIIKAIKLSRTTRRRNYSEKREKVFFVGKLRTIEHGRKELCCVNL
jgi:hypothetical protein